MRNLLRNRRVRLVVALITLAGVSGVVAASIQSAGATGDPPSSATAARSAGGAAAGGIAAGGTAAGGAGAAALGRPNIVFVLTDDLSMDLLRFMPNVQAMQVRGLTFNDYYVSDSLCCPSRSSIFSGNFPHDTHVFGNVGPEGGFHAFYNRGEEQHTFAVALQQAGYRTAMMGKYLNGYLDGPGGPRDVPATYVPPGWSEWDVAGQAYPEFNYRLNENGTLRRYGDQPSDYLTDVLARKGVSFINSSAASGQPFFLELATFAPHFPYTPAPRNANDFPGLTAPHPPSFNVLPTHAPAWLADHPPLTPGQIDRINSVFRKRAQAVQAVDDMIGRVEQALSANGVARNTYLVFSSDNGLHTGEYRLMPGKMTAFDTDIRVPLVVVGPGVAAGETSAMAENVDLAKTFAAIGGTTLPSDGHSLLPALQGQTPDDWRNAILVEHHGPDLRGIDPDFQQTSSGNPRTYEAMRTHRFLYVEYDNGEREFYDLSQDPFELQNLADQLTWADRILLHTDLTAMENCHDGLSCWASMHVDKGLLPMRRRARPRPG
jgi:N-acetylglucosamine-6-sulfatase